VNRVPDIQTAREFLQSPLATKTLNDLTAIVASTEGCGPQVIFHRAYLRDKGALLTVTPNHDGDLLGLHVDAWERAPEKEETALRWRMSINIGSTERYFLFVNLTPNQLQSIVHDEIGWKEPISNWTELGRIFMTHFPAYPVVLLLVRPLEFYIAPTESYYSRR
jgi:hypothetical protein